MIVDGARAATVRRGLRLEYLNVAYNAAEAVIALAAGGAASSIALIGFGVDSVIETLSSLVMLWRLRHDHHPSREAIERRAHRLIGVSFLLLAAYIAYESIETLLDRHAPHHSPVGIALAIASVILMPILARWKAAVGRELGSAAMVADSRQTHLCSYLSAILLLGLVLNATVGWWWADPVAGLIMVPIILKEGVDGLKGNDCGCHTH